MKVRNAYKIVVAKTDGKRLLRRCRRMWDKNMKLNLDF
jgi:hypothetical protein